MAGLTAYGDLTDAISPAAPIDVEHRLESVRLVAAGGANPGPASLHASLLSDAVARPESCSLTVSVSFVRLSLHLTTVTEDDLSSWSSTVDSLAADADGAGQFPRLFVLSAGNTDDPGVWGNYPASLSTNLVHDPGQAWNALTVGACTHKSDTQDPNYTPVASTGDLSPYTTTSASWNSAWPLKPDVVLEGGNLGDNGLGPIGMSSLQLLTANNEPLTRLFTTFNATSAASALCARMSAQIAAITRVYGWRPSGL